MIIQNFKTKSGLEAYEYGSTTDGPKLIVFGAIHGDEPCGTAAMFKLINKFKNNDIPLKKGKLTMIPVCNPEAYNQGVRFIEQDLNRIFAAPDLLTIEGRHALDLIDLIKGHDYILDIHSTSSHGPAFVFDDENLPETQKLAQACLADYVLTGWPVLYEGTPGEGGTTLDGARKQNIKGVCLECGQHDDPAAIDVAYASLVNIMAILGLCDPFRGPEKHSTPETLKMTKRILRPDEKSAFVKNWQGFDVVTKGDILTRNQDGSPLHTADTDGYIIMPSQAARKGQEWFYFAERSLDIP